MSTSRLIPAIASLILLAPGAARAQSDPITVSMVTHVPVGKKPTVTLKANERVTNLVLELTRLDGSKKTETRVGAMGAGQSKTFPLSDGAVGGDHVDGKITCNLGTGEPWTGEFAVDTVVNQEIRIGYQREHLFLDKKILEFQISRPSRKLEVDLQVYGDSGGVIGTAQKTFENVAAGKWIALPWESTDDAQPVMMMKLHAQDGGGFVDQTLTPWQVSIPHEDVNFPTNSFVIEEGERPKLDSAYDLIAAEVAKAEKLDVKCSLYVSGHTDTVGPRDKNQVLSLNRAKAIATYLRGKGLSIKVSYEGFGEDRPRVQTPDETDEPKNRRADYTLSAEGPPSSGQVFKWKEVK